MALGYKHLSIIGRFRSNEGFLFSENGCPKSWCYNLGVSPGKTWSGCGFTHFWQQTIPCLLTAFSFFISISKPLHRGLEIQTAFSMRFMITRFRSCISLKWLGISRLKAPEPGALVFELETSNDGFLKFGSGALYCQDVDKSGKKGYYMDSVKKRRIRAQCGDIRLHLSNWCFDRGF